MISLWNDKPFAWLRSALDTHEISQLRVAGALNGAAGRRLGLTASLIDGIRPITEAIQKRFERYEPVRVVSFSKTNKSNWQVPWHQDRVIAVEKKAEVNGFSNWSNKNGQWHCEPLIDVLEDMLFVRVFLDSCDEKSGGMEFAAGSHVEGLVSSAQAMPTAERYQSEIETADAGDILILPMLTLHRSRPAMLPNSRRVLRIDFARNELPTSLSWCDYSS